MTKLFPCLSKKPFWDVKFDDLDSEKDRHFIIKRIMEFGTLEEMQAIITFYGEEIIKQEIVLASWLSERTIAFCCLLLSLKPTDFRCYEKKRLMPEHWNY